MKFKNLAFGKHPSVEAIMAKVFTDEGKCISIVCGENMYSSSKAGKGKACSSIKDAISFEVMVGDDEPLGWQTKLDIDDILAENFKIKKVNEWLLNKGEKTIFATVNKIHTYSPPQDKTQDNNELFIGMECFVEDTENIKGLSMLNSFDLTLNISPYEFLNTFDQKTINQIKKVLIQKIKSK